MREVRVEWVVEASPPIVERALEPAAVVEYEGSFDVRAVEAEGEATRVVAGGGRFVALTYRFIPADDVACRYEVAGDGGPFSAMQTEVSLTSVDCGTRVVATSMVGLDLPLPFGDRIAAWKRRGELRRLLANLADGVE